MLLLARWLGSAAWVTSSRHVGVQVTSRKHRSAWVTSHRHVGAQVVGRRCTGARTICCWCSRYVLMAYDLLYMCIASWACTWACSYMRKYCICRLLHACLCALGVACGCCCSHAPYFSSCRKWSCMCGWAFSYMCWPVHVLKEGHMCNTYFPWVF